MLGPRDPRSAVLSPSDAQVRQYVTAESAFRQRAAGAGRSAQHPRVEVVNRVIAEGVKELEGILSPLQLDLARPINLDYRLPEGMRHLRLTPDQWEPLLRINRRFDATEKRMMEERNDRWDTDLSGLKKVESERRAAILDILTKAQRAEIQTRPTGR